MKFQWMIAAALISGPISAGQILADETPDAIQSLKQQLEQLEQKLKILERKRELDTEDTEVRSKATPRLTAGASGFTISSADSNFVLRVQGGLQTDGRFYLDNFSANDTFGLRRVRPTLEGTVFGKFDYRIMTDFASGVSVSAGNNGSILVAYVNARFLPELQVQAGKFKEPVGLERLQTWQNLLLVERGFPTQLVPNRDTGLMIHGSFWKGVLGYQVGVFNGTADGGSSDFETADEDKDIAARLFTHPFQNTDLTGLKGLGLGISGTVGDHSGSLRNYSSHGQQRFFGYRTGTGAAPNVLADGNSSRISPQGYYYWGSFGLFGEYVVSAQDVLQAGGGATAGTTAELRNTAWQVAASYFLTGEQNSWRPVTPLKNFSPAKGGWGAWEVAARVGELDVDDDAFPIFSDPNQNASKAFSWGVGVNWHLNRNVKVQLNYENTGFGGGGANSALAGREHVVFTRAQIVF